MEEERRKKIQRKHKNKEQVRTMHKAHKLTKIKSGAGLDRISPESFMFTYYKLQGGWVVNFKLQLADGGGALWFEGRGGVKWGRGS